MNTVHPPHNLRGRAAPGPWSPMCPSPAASLPLPRLVTTIPPSIFKTHPQTRFFCSTAAKCVWTEELQHSALRAHSPSGDQESETRRTAPRGGPGSHSPLPQHLTQCPPVSECCFIYAKITRQGTNRDTLEWGQAFSSSPRPLPAAEFGCGSPCTGWLSELAARCPAGLPRSHHTYVRDNQPWAAEKPGSCPPASQISLPDSLETSCNTPSARALAPSLLPKDRCFWIHNTGHTETNMEDVGWFLRIQL